MAQAVRQAKLSEETYAAVTRLAAASNTTQTEILGRAVKLLEREQFFAELNAGFAELSEKDRLELNEERQEWDATLENVE